MKCNLPLVLNVLPVFLYSNVEPTKKKKKLSEFEQALIIARNKVKETADKLEERQNKLGIYQTKDRAIIGTLST